MRAPRANQVVAEPLRSPASERVRHHRAADIDGRHRRRITMRTEGGLVFLLDLPEATHLRDGDGLVLEDGAHHRRGGGGRSRWREITARTPHHLARIAWHIGNRHVPAADSRRPHPHPPRPRHRGDGARARRRRCARVEAPFEPEGGAYDAGARTRMAHAHHHHEHGARSCAHDHAHAAAHSP